jgi:hypothetical protein
LPKYANGSQQQQHQQQQQQPLHANKQRLYMSRARGPLQQINVKRFLNSQNFAAKDFFSPTFAKKKF